MKTGCMVGYPAEMKSGNPPTFMLKPRAQLCEHDSCAPVGCIEDYGARGVFVVEATPVEPYCVPYKDTEEDDGNKKVTEVTSAAPEMTTATTTMTPATVKPTARAGTVKGRFN